MESEAHYQAVKARNKRRSTMCKNCTVEIKEVAETFELEIGGCKSERRNGSAWCQECSDAHKAKLLVS